MDLGETPEIATYNQFSEGRERAHPGTNRRQRGYTPPELTIRHPSHNGSQHEGPPTHTAVFYSNSLSQAAKLRDKDCGWRIGVADLCTYHRKQGGRVFTGVGQTAAPLFPSAPVFAHESPGSLPGRQWPLSPLRPAGRGRLNVAAASGSCVRPCCFVCLLTNENQQETKKQEARRAPSTMDT